MLLRFSIVALAVFFLLDGGAADAADIRIIAPPAAAVPAGGFESKGIQARVVPDGSGGFMIDANSPAASSDKIDIWISLSGTIVPGDSERLDRMVQRAYEREPGSSIRVLLDSPGGDYAEAMKIAEATQRTMVVGPGGTCHAACTIILMSGRQIDGDGYLPPDRYAHIDAEINFFAPEFDFPENASPAQLSAAYDRAIALSRDLLRNRRLWWISNDFFLALVTREHDWKKIANTSNISLIGAGN